MVHPKMKTLPLKIAVYWIIVLIPLGWGVFQNVVKSIPILNRSATQNTATLSLEK